MGMNTTMVLGVQDPDWCLALTRVRRVDATGELEKLAKGTDGAKDDRNRVVTALSALWPMIQATENEWISVSILAYPGGMVVSAADTT